MTIGFDIDRWRWASFPLGVWVATRAIALYLGYLSLTLVPNVQVPSGSTAFRDHASLYSLCRQDCGWFDRIARNGYTIHKESNFWPGLPMSARALAAVTPIPVEWALILIPNFACLAAYLLIYRMFSELDGDGAARWALVAWAAFPFSFFHSAAYPEALLILSTTLAVWLARRNKHIRAGIALGLGVLSRHVTILWGASLAVAQLRQRGLRRSLLSPALLGLLMPFVLAGLYPLYCQYRWGDPLAFWKARLYWGEMAWWGIGTVLSKWRVVPQAASYIVWATVPTIGALWLLRRKRHAALAAAALPFLAILWTVGAWGLGRYAASCWPAFLPVGCALDRRPWLRVPLLVSLSVAQGWYFFLYSHHYDVF